MVPFCDGLLNDAISGSAGDGASPHDGHCCRAQSSRHDGWGEGLGHGQLAQQGWRAGAHSVGSARGTGVKFEGVRTLQDPNWSEFAIDCKCYHSNVF